MRRVFSPCLFVLAFAPVWVAILFTDGLSIIRTEAHHITEWVSIICIIVLFIISTIVVFTDLGRQDKSNSRKLTIKNASEEKSATSEIMLAYILPMIAFDFTKWDQMALFLFFFILLCMLCSCHNYYMVNVVLELIAHYRIYNCQLIDAGGNQFDRTVLSKKRLNNYRGEPIFVVGLNNEYSLEVE